ncbi:hypothetical protein F5B19DRAFT_406755 [Rostrohypoxylon terebratum]|nr:hypothetical protein F5B19DRAFT_406755 [Rostrohypoxylon terebratum]
MESLETIQTRHRKEQRELQARITNKKKNATKKTRKGVNDECAELERQLKERQEQELAALNGGEDADADDTTAAGAPDERDERDEDGQVNGTDTITGKLKEVRFDEPSGANNNNNTNGEEGGQQQQQSQGKKRNRQKERMARRAAEQEAATAAAEQEAANMTDYRKVEKTYLLKEFKANGLVEREIRPDGHCLFSAIADQLQARNISLSSAGEGDVDGEGKRELPYKVVRRRATEYMEKHPDDFAPFLEEPLDGYVRKMRDTAEWGGQLELTALANAYGVEIKVLQDGRTDTIEPSTGTNGDEERRIWLAYYRHGYGLGEHYNSLRKAE